MTDKESAKKPTALLAPIAGTRTHDPSTTDKKSSALPTPPLLGPAETNTHIGFLGCIHLISEWILYCINGLGDTGYIQSKIPRSGPFTFCWFGVHVV